MIVSLTSLGFGVVATIDTVSWDAAAGIFFNNVGTIPLVQYLLLPVVIRVPNRDLACGKVNCRFQRTFERRTFLDDAVCHELEFVALREFSRFLVNGTILEAKHHFGGYAIAGSILSCVTHREGLPLKRSQHEKAMSQALSVTHIDLVCP
jgi:hypothetical protein